MKDYHQFGYMPPPMDKKKPLGNNEFAHGLIVGFFLTSITLIVFLCALLDAGILEWVK